MSTATAALTIARPTTTTTFDAPFSTIFDSPFEFAGRTRNQILHIGRMVYRVKGWSQVGAVDNERRSSP
jgi:hypothetical protein